MRRLAILGAGGHGKVVADAALAAGWDEIYFHDDDWPKKQENSHWPIVGNYPSLMKNIEKYNGVIVAIGDNVVRWERHSELADKRAKMISIAHPSAKISQYAVIGVGTVILANAVINIDAKIGDACIINTSATIDHDSVLKNAVHVCPGANLSGAVSVGFAGLIGVGSSIKQNINIGDRVVVGAGSVVIADILDCTTVVGNPAKQIHATHL
jgi:sugar O-acyltransferase (sialic acid O-acetyltransferase NeuD family)